MKDSRVHKNSKLSVFLEDIDEGQQPLVKLTSCHCYFEDFQQLGYDAPL